MSQRDDPLADLAARHPVRFLLGVGAYLVLAVCLLVWMYDLLGAWHGEWVVPVLMVLAVLSSIALPAVFLAAWDRGSVRPFKLREAVLQHRRSLIICIVAVCCVGMLAGDHVFLLWERTPHDRLREWRAMLSVAVGPFLFFAVCLSTLYGVWIVGGIWRNFACALLGVLASAAFVWIGFAWMVNHGS